MEEINYDIMRYELDEENYIYKVYFGCASGSCKGYTGIIPDGYETLAEWAENENIRAYKIVEGNLVYDNKKAAEIEAQCEIEAQNNACATVGYVNDKFQQPNKLIVDELANTIEGSTLIQISDSGDYDISNLKIFLNPTDKEIQLKITNNNLIKSDAVSQTKNGVQVSVNEDSSMTLNGTATSDTEIVLRGTIDNTDMLFLLKANTNYYLSGLINGSSISLYNYNGTDRTLIAESSNGIINISSNEVVTEVVLNITNGTAFSNAKIYPMLTISDTPKTYKEAKENDLIKIDLSSFALKDNDYIEIKDENINLVSNGEEYSIDNIKLLKTFYDETYVMVNKPNNISLEYFRYKFFIETINNIKNDIDGVSMVVEEKLQPIKTITNKNILYLENAFAPANLFELRIKGSIKLFYLGENSYLGEDTYLLNTYLIHDKAETLTEEAKKYHLPINYLHYKDENTFDEFVLTNEECYIIRRVGENEDGTLYVLDNEDIEYKEHFEIPMFENDNYFYLEHFSTNNLIFTGAYEINNNFNKNYAKKSELKLTEEGIKAEVSKKVGNEEIIARINMAIQEIEDDEIPEGIEKSIIEISANKISIDSDHCTLTKDGVLTLRNRATEPYEYTINDVLAIQNYIQEKNSLTPELLELYDANGDGKVNTLDAIKILNIIKGNVESTKYADTEITLNPLSPTEFINMTLGNAVQCRIGLNEIYNYTFRGMNMFLGTFADMENQYGVSVNGEKGEIKITSDEAVTETYIDAGKIDAYYVLSGSRGQKGRCLHGIDETHDYLCHWDGANLQFYVDDTMIGSLSDKNLKQEIQDINENLINVIADLEFKQFKLINKNGRISVGIIAQDLIKIFEENNINIKDYDFVSQTQYSLTDKTEYYVVNYEQFLLLHSKFLRNKIDNQQKMIDFLVNKLNYKEELENYLKGEK